MAPYDYIHGSHNSSKILPNIFSKRADSNNTQLIEDLLTNNDLSYSAQHSADVGRLIKQARVYHLMKSENVSRRGKEDKRLHMDLAARNHLAAVSLVYFLYFF